MNTRNNKKRVIVIVSAILAVVVLSAAVFATVRLIGSLKLFGSKLLPDGGKIESFDADWYYFAVGEDETVTFTAKADAAPALFLGQDNMLGVMNDDGNDGDKQAGDGIYSLSVTFASNQEKQVSYYAGFDEPQAGPVILYCYDEPTEDEQNDYLNCIDEIEELDAAFEDDNGYVAQADTDEIFSAVESYAEKLESEGRAAEHRVNEDNVYIRFSSGLSYMYIPPIEGNASRGDDVRYSVVTCEPFKRQFPEVQVDDVAYDISSSISDISLYNRTDDDVVSVNGVKNDFSSDRIILWFGHGAYDSMLHSVILTGERTINGFLYIEDYITGRLTSGSGTIGFTHRFIEKYCDSLDHSFIYLNCCSSGKDDVLAQTLLDKGAAAVIGNTDTIKATYAHYIQISAMYNMLESNESTGKLNTIEEALRLSTDEYGEDDTEYGGVGARPVIFGDKSLRLAESVDKKDDDNDSVSVDWSSIYYHLIVDNAYSVPTHDEYDSMIRVYDEIPLALHDFDMNGTPELIIGNIGARLGLEVFTIVDSEAVYAGGMGGKGSFYSDNEMYHGIFRTDSWYETQVIGYSGLSDGKLQHYEVLEGKYNQNKKDFDYTVKDETLFQVYLDCTSSESDDPYAYRDADHGLKLYYWRDILSNGWNSFVEYYGYQGVDSVTGERTHFDLGGADVSLVLPADWGYTRKSYGSTEYISFYQKDTYDETNGRIGTICNLMCMTDEGYNNLKNGIESYNYYGKIGSKYYAMSWLSGYGYNPETDNLFDQALSLSREVSNTFQSSPESVK